MDVLGVGRSLYLISKLTLAHRALDLFSNNLLHYNLKPVVRNLVSY